MPSGVSKWEDPVTNLDEVEATGAGDWIVTGTAEIIRYLIVASSVTSGGTVKIQGNTLADGSGTTVEVDSTAVTANGTTRVEVDGNDLFPAMRTNLTARTDGTYSTTSQRRV